MEALETLSGWLFYIHASRWRAYYRPLRVWLLFPLLPLFLNPGVLSHMVFPLPGNKRTAIFERSRTLISDGSDSTSDEP